MVKLQWLQVNKFRSVKPGTRLTFNPGHNVLLGQNGTGKTTLLNLIAAAVKSDFTDFKEEEFDLSYALVAGEVSLTVSVRNESRSHAVPSALTRVPTGHPNAFAAMSALNTLVMSFTVEVDSSFPGGRFELKVEGKSGSIQRIHEAEPRALVSTAGPCLWMTITMGLSQYYRDGKNDPVTESLFNGLEGLFVEFEARRFDESLGYFNDMGVGHMELRRTQDGTVFSPSHSASADSIPGGIVAHANRNWGANRYALTDDELPFLKRAVRLLDFESAEFSLELQTLNVDKQSVVMRLGNPRFHFHHRGGWRVSGEMLSYGQKRMLAFLQYAASAAAVIIADELVNGLHHQWIRACFEMMDRKQLFLTSQNPLLLDYLGFQSVEDVHSTFVLCRWDKESEQMVWENMSQEAAQDFFDSYKVGFQQVGELLQTKGLW